MHVSITFRHLHPTEGIKEHVEGKVALLKKYLIKPIEVHVILSVEKFRHQCEVVLSEGQFRAAAIETGENLYTAIDLALHKIERQVRKHKEIVKEHKNHMPGREVAFEA